LTVEYRLMRAEEERVVLGMWGEPAYQAARLATDPAAHAHTYVAAASDGTILSTLHYHVTVRRDATGTPRRVGEIDSVVTRAEARRQGHATRLLLLALDALLAAGCDWSLLVATDEGRPLYERHGYRCYGEPWRRGAVTGPLPQGDSRYLVRPYDPLQEPAGWDQIAAVDLAFNRRRPLTIVRDVEYWRTYAAWRVGNWIADEGLVIFGAFRGDADPALCGFAFAEFYPPAFQVRDAGVLAEEPGAMPAVLTQVAAEARRRGSPLAGRMYLPREPPIDAALEQLFGPTLYAGQDQGHVMARPIAADFRQRDLDAIFAAPGAHFSAVDVF
jgi:GNAT superfamily N-acetyltransferase